MRGKGQKKACPAPAAGITPAYAGKRVQKTAIMEAPQDHPRLCGEKRTATSHLPPRSGSPPPMRGKAVVAGKAALRRGITPAYAGKSSGSWCQPLSNRDHPRLCGEKRNSESYCIAKSGSPPPMRGKGSPANAAAIFFGITPAYAGKSILQPSFGKSNWDHPRLCGEKCRKTGRRKKLMGITPAYAGKRTL